jgi:putative phosphoserine phosphatase / 1-acylglycerol-3-phosphate O-acyltransferase
MVSDLDQTRIAAFFDLDRTILPDAAGMHLAAGLIEAGLLEGWEKRGAELFRPVASVLRETYRRTGETWLSVQMSRRGMRGLIGRPVERLRAAGEQIVERLDDKVFSEARALIATHKARGHLVVIASSTWRGVVEPLAARLGADRVLATDYAIEEGRFSGDLLGAWLFGPAKAAAVRELAEREGILLSESYAYTDAWYDRFLLEEVGHPRAVNPDLALRALALTRGWPVLEFRNSEGSGSAGADLFDLLRPMLHPALLPVRIDVEGIENIPREGPCVVASNHRSYLDGLVLAALGSKRGRKLRFLGKREVFDAPVVGHVARAAGQIPVDRGSGSLRPVRDALDALDRGETVAILPQGTIPRGEAFFDPRLHGRVGVARLAIASGAPVIPVALWGTERIWPRAARIPDLAGLKGTVYARIGEPMYLKVPSGDEEDDSALEAATQEVMDRIAELLPEELRVQASPSAEEISAASPPHKPVLGELLALPGRAALGAIRAIPRTLRNVSGR